MANTSPWWCRCVDGEIVSVVLIQFDLVGHSAWSAEQEAIGSRSSAYADRKRLALGLRNAAAGYGAAQHHWAGDGGVFALRCASADDADKGYDAMAQMYGAFDRWRGESTTTLSFSCRITGTYIPDLCIDREAGNWYSSALNNFLKYERQIGFENAICITNELRRMLTKHKGRFDGTGRRVPIADGTTITVFADKDHPIKVDESPTSFRTWLFKNRDRLDAAAPTVSLDALPAGATQVGNSVLLTAALSPDGYRLISLDEHSPTRFSGDILTEADRLAWSNKLAELARRNVQGTSFRVHTLDPEFPDDPILRVGWSQGVYADANAFHSVMAATPAGPKRYRANALKVLQDGTTLPNTLSNHAIVVIGGPENRHVLLCHRRKDDRPGSYLRNRWSVSYEEQYNPIEGRVGNDVMARDFSIHGSVERGIRGEILGKEFTGTIKVSVHAFQLETAFLNFGFLAIVELPGVDFAKIMEFWPGAPEADEHDAIAALPLRGDLLRECLRSPRLPERVFRELQTSPGFEALDEKDHCWHETSPVRLALATWLSQQP